MDLELNSFLQKNNFEKQYQKLIKKLKNKKVVVYGCGQLFQVINDNYDLSKLNILGVSDMKFLNEDEGKDFLGYKIIPKSKIESYSPDFILLATLNYVSVIKNFDTKIKLMILCKRPLLEVLKEIWCN